MTQGEKHVLVVDDNPAIQQFLGMLLEDEGYCVTVARNGEDALNMLRGMAQTPDLILLDLNMPIMTGWEFRRAQKRDNSIAHIPVIVVSANQNINDMPFTIDAVDYFQKPFDIPRLVRRITDIFGMVDGTMAA